MSQQAILFTLAGVFVIIGILFLLWGRREAGKYDQALSHRFDLREFLERTPFRPEPWALKVGGWIAIAVAFVLLGVGVFFLVNG